MGRRFEFLGYSGMTAAKKELAKGDLDKMVFRPTGDRYDLSALVKNTTSPVTIHTTIIKPSF